MLNTGSTWIGQGLTLYPLISIDIFRDSLSSCSTLPEYVESPVVDCSSKFLSSPCKGTFDDEEVKRGLVLGRKSNNEGNAIGILNRLRIRETTLMAFTELFPSLRYHNFDVILKIKIFLWKLILKNDAGSCWNNCNGWQNFVASVSFGKTGR